MGIIGDKVKSNPIKYYLWLILSFTIFFTILFLIIGGTTLVSFQPLVESMFNSTSVSNLSSIAYFTSSGESMLIDFLISMFTLFGGFGGFCYIFYSIRDGKITDKDEFIYGFEGCLAVILFLDVLLFVSLITGKWATPKIIELFYLLAFPFIAIIFAIIYNSIFPVIEENYEYRISIINFLKKNDDRIILSQHLDSFLRELIRDFDRNATIIFLLFAAMIFFGVFQNFNPLSIISMMLFSLVIFSGYSRIILLKLPTSNIELLKRNPQETTFSYISTPVTLSNIFILKESADYVTILTDKPNEKKIISFSKNCICSIHDNEYEIFEDKEHPLLLWGLTRVICLTLTIIAFYFVFTILVFFIPTKQSWILFFAVLISSIVIGVYSVHRMKKRIDKFFENCIKFLRSL